MTYKSLKMIAVSEKNYLILKRLGRAGDSFNDVITEVLKQKKLPTDPIRATNSHDENTVTEDTITSERDYTKHTKHE
jgi:predicted CopG family antitoxin